MSHSKDQADFALIRQHVSLKEILEYYGLFATLKQSGGELRGQCPFHEAGKAPRSFTVNLEKNLFQCFHCKAKGNVIDFVAKKEGTGLREAGLLIYKTFNVVGRNSTPPPAQDSPSEPRNQQPTGEQPTAQQFYELFAEMNNNLKAILLELRSKQP
jgi:DNA primase